MIVIIKDKKENSFIGESSVRINDFSALLCKNQNYLKNFLRTNNFYQINNTHN